MNILRHLFFFVSSGIALTGVLAQPSVTPPAAQKPSGAPLSIIIPNPGAEAADGARTWQGIPGIERAPNGRLWAIWYTGGDERGAARELLRGRHQRR